MRFRDFIEEMKKDEEFKTQYEKASILIEFAREMVLLRKSKGLTQEQLANLVGTKKSNISRIEKGLQNLSVEMMIKIADALGTKLNVSLTKGKQVSLSESEIEKLNEIAEKYGKSLEEILSILIQREYEQLKHREFGKLRDEFENEWNINLKALDFEFAKSKDLSAM